MRRLLPLVFASFALLALLIARRADACAMCGCGDPTLTTMGAEQPFGGRLRLSSELRYRTDRIGPDGAARTDIAEVRLDSALAWAPSRNWMLSATVPVLERDVDQELLHQRAVSLGDIEATVRRVLYRDRYFAPHHLISLIAGLKLPTAPVDHDGAGRPLSSDAQPGTGSFDPELGLAYAYFDDPRSAYVSTIARLPLHGRDGLTVGPSLRTTLSLQQQMETLFAFRLSVDTRLDGVTHLGGVADADSGGFIAFLSPGMLISPSMDVLLEFAIHVPVVSALRGMHKEGPVLSAGVVYDL